MKVTIKHINSGINKKYHEFFNDFIKFLQKEIPLNHDITILFLNERIKGMSTGGRNGYHILKILTRHRMIRDICRTLVHEWQHEKQFAILHRKHGADIGGKNENEANAISGALVKKFEKEYPKKEHVMYQSIN